MITAKVACNLKQEYSGGGDRYVTVGFMPDYADDRNKEWAYRTPSLQLQMTLRGDVADKFEPGWKYTLSFVRDD